MDWKARIAAAQAKKDAAEAKLTDADRAELDARAVEARLLAEAREADKVERGLALARREDAAREKLGAKVPLRILDLEGDSPGAGTFIIKYPGKEPVSTWQREMAASATDRKIDRDLVNRNFAAAAVADWNGKTEDELDKTTAGAELLELLKDRPFIATTITNIAGELGGLVFEARKS